MNLSHRPLGGQDPPVLLSDVQNQVPKGEVNCRRTHIIRHWQLSHGGRDELGQTVVEAGEGQWEGLGLQVSPGGLE